MILAMVRTLAVSCVSCIAVAGCDYASLRPESETCLSVIPSMETMLQVWDRTKSNN